MKTAFLQLLSLIPPFVSFESEVLADVAPPVGPLLVLSTGALIAGCCLVTVIVLASFFVIRAIKKNNSPKDGD
ncbi:MAG: hypothetical protein AB1649_22380 [Chloroflexota bacterium]